MVSKHTKAEHYRAKAVQYAHIAENSPSAEDKRILQHLEASYLSLAEAEDWLAAQKPLIKQSVLAPFDPSKRRVVLLRT